MVSIKTTKFIKSLKIKKYRFRERAFLIEGHKNVSEALSSSYVITHLLVTNEYLLQNGHLKSQSSYSLIEVSPEELGDLGSFQSNHDCLAVAQMNPQSTSVNFNDHLFVLDGISDPGNLGTILRTLDWFGFSSVVCSEDTADFYNPKVINASMGSFTRVAPYYTNIVEFLANLSNPIVGADLEAKSLSHWKPAEPAVVVMGSESHGLSSGVHRLLTDRFSIPRFGNAESLNVGIATGIFCHHLRTMPS